LDSIGSYLNDSPISDLFESLRCSSLERFEVLVRTVYSERLGLMWDPRSATEASLARCPSGCMFSAVLVERDSEKSWGIALKEWRFC
jgi:hypothetical protein